jgi:hypothetical protein
VRGGGFKILKKPRIWDVKTLTQDRVQRQFLAKSFINPGITSLVELLSTNQARYYKYTFCSYQLHNCLRSLERWDREFESHSRHGCLCAFIVCDVLRVGSGLAMS